MGIHRGDYCTMHASPMSRGSAIREVTRGLSAAPASQISAATTRMIPCLATGKALFRAMLGDQES